MLTRAKQVCSGGLEVMESRLSWEIVVPVLGALCI